MDKRRPNCALQHSVCATRPECTVPAAQSPRPTEPQLETALSRQLPHRPPTFLQPMRLEAPLQKKESLPGTSWTSSVELCGYGPRVAPFPLRAEALVAAKDACGRKGCKSLVEDEKVLKLQTAVMPTPKLRSLHAHPCSTRLNKTDRNASN